MLVTAEQEKATGAAVGYAASRSATATKTDTAIAETPQSITVIGAEQIDTLKAQNITDAIAYAIGGARAPYIERIGDEVMLRGFIIPTSFRDGTRYTKSTWNWVRSQPAPLQYAPGLGCHFRSVQPQRRSAFGGGTLSAARRSPAALAPSTWPATAWCHSPASASPSRRWLA